MITNKNLTLNEIRQLKKDLEVTLTKEIKHFQEITDTNVDSIDINYVEAIDDVGQRKVYLESVKVILNYE